MGLFDRILKVGGTFDWISPAVQMIEGGGMTGIRGEIPAGLSGRDVQRTLERNGVRVGRTPMIVNGEFVMNVDNPDKAFDILSRLYGG